MQTWECPPVPGLQISAWAGVTNPELEEQGEGVAPHSGRVGELHPWEAPAACMGRPKVTHTYTHTHKLNTSRNDWQWSTSPTSPFVVGGLVFNP